MNYYSYQPQQQLVGRLEQIVSIAGDYGGVDGGHHKQYALDQILRVALGPAYDQWRADYEEIDEFGEPVYSWDEGIPS